MDIPENDQSGNDAWSALRTHTDARIGTTRAGTSISSAPLLNFRLDHAHARDAVYSVLDADSLVHAMRTVKTEVLHLHSLAASRVVYLQRPDLGRQLDDHSKALLKDTATPRECDVCIILADGLSANAINENAMPLLQVLIPMLRDSGMTLSPLALVEQGRVAIGDEIGLMMNARLSLILIGERPGLSSPNSLGAYLTFNPSPGLTDESRNCVSNIRNGGLSFIEAAEKIFYLTQQSLKRKLSGVLLKDHSGLLH